jgi:hypothetical protein
MEGEALDVYSFPFGFFCFQRGAQAFALTRRSVRLFAFLGYPPQSIIAVAVKPAME